MDRFGHLGIFSLGMGMDGCECVWEGMVLWMGITTTLTGSTDRMVCGWTVTRVEVLSLEKTGRRELKVREVPSFGSGYVHVR